MDTSLIILDGAKGAGKSTIAEILNKKLENTKIVSLDATRRLIDGSKATDEYNKIAYEKMLVSTKSLLEEGITVIIDSGLREEQVTGFKNVASSLGKEVHLFHLDASRDVLRERVKERDAARNKTFNPERFDYTFDVQRSKDFSEFHEIFTEGLTPEHIAEQILKEIR